MSGANQQYPSLGANLSVRNEEHRILRQHLENLREFCDEIVVTVDEASDDRTYDICREYTEKVFRIPSGDYGENIRRHGSRHITCDWELWVDADHLFPAPLQQEIKEAIGTGKHPCYHLPMVNMFFGHWFLQRRHWNYQLRLFHRGHTTYSRDDLHNWRFSYEGEAGYLNYPFLHYGLASVEEFLGIINRYTSLDLEKIQQNRSGGLIDQPMETPDLQTLVKEPLRRFDHLYNSLGYKDEKEFGALYAWLFSMYTFVEKAKLYEADHKQEIGWEYGKIDMQEVCRNIDDALRGEGRPGAKKSSSRMLYFWIRVIRGLTPPYLAELYRRLGRRK